MSLDRSLLYMNTHTVDVSTCKHTHTALCWRLTCVSVEDLAAVGEQLKNLQLAAVGGHHDVTVTFSQELHVQHLVTVAHKLKREGE